MIQDGYFGTYSQIGLDIPDYRVSVSGSRHFLAELPTMTETSSIEKQPIELHRRPWDETDREVRFQGTSAAAGKKAHKDFIARCLIGRLPYGHMMRHDVDHGFKY